MPSQITEPNTPQDGRDDRTETPRQGADLQVRREKPNAPDISRASSSVSTRSAPGGIRTPNLLIRIRRRQSSGPEASPVDGKRWLAIAPSASGWGHVGVSRGATSQAQPGTCDPACQAKALSLTHASSDSGLGPQLLANRRPPMEWVSTLLGPRALSGLVYPSLDRATGTAVAREEAIHHQPAASSSRRLVDAKIRPWHSRLTCWRALSASV